VILDEFVVDLAGWMPGWPQVISNGLIPTALFIGLLAGVYIAIKRVFRAPRLETVQALVIFLVVMFVMLTIICAIFRGEGMALRWPGVRSI
jgi:membrane protein YdbS with pleckstrin-like domain